MLPSRPTATFTSAMGTEITAWLSSTRTDKFLRTWGKLGRAGRVQPTAFHRARFKRARVCRGPQQLTHSGLRCQREIPERVEEHHHALGNGHHEAGRDLRLRQFADALGRNSGCAVGTRYSPEGPALHEARYRGQAQTVVGAAERRQTGTGRLGAQYGSRARTAAIYFAEVMGRRAQKFCAGGGSTLAKQTLPRKEYDYLEVNL